MIGPGVGLGVMALAAASPLGIHMGKHALVDGFFAFWATLCLWLLWENLQRPNNLRWLIAFGASLALMVMTKENSFFVYIAMCGIVVLNRWARFGTVTRGLVLTGILGPLFAVVVLLSLAGGFAPFVEIYKLLVTKAQNLDYAIATGDGPWYRYLIELTVSDPIVFVLAMTGLFTLPLRNKAFGYLIAFVVFSYVMMCNVKYAMNLRYTTIWALPLAALATAQIFQLAGFAGRFPRTIAAVMIAGICAFNLGQYKTFFVNNAIYEPVPLETLRAIGILKEMPRPK
jgi:4-amino-4-deoxy-L-arabinose transferase-like glycosyltransferase